MSRVGEMGRELVEFTVRRMVERVYGYIPGSMDKEEWIDEITDQILSEYISGRQKVDPEEMRIQCDMAMENWHGEK